MQRHSLVEITYYRNGNKDDSKKAVVTERQACDIKLLLHHIRIIETKEAPVGSKRDYILS